MWRGHAWRGHSPAAQLLRSTQHGGQAAQIHLHGGDLSGGVQLQDGVARGLGLEGVAAGHAQVDAAVLLQQPPAQRQPHAAARARHEEGGGGKTLGARVGTPRGPLPTPDPVPVALTRWRP